jgi:hypothetical protein
VGYIKDNKFSVMTKIPIFLQTISFMNIIMKVPRHGMERKSNERHGIAWKCMARQGKEWHGKEIHGMESQGKVGKCKARKG